MCRRAVLTLTIASARYSHNRRYSEERRTCASGVRGMSHLRARQPKLSWWLGFLKRVSGVQAAQQDNLVGFPEQPKSATFARLTTGIIFAGKEKSSEEIGIAALCWDNVLS